MLNSSAVCSTILMIRRPGLCERDMTASAPGEASRASSRRRARLA